MIIYGELPKRIAYYTRPAEIVKRGWQGIDNLDIAPPITATPAFAVDSASKDGRKTAAQWSMGWDKMDLAQPTELDNAPISSVEVLTLEKRREGGRAYKVRLRGVVDDTYYVDLREDVLLDALLAGGAKKGGLLSGPFVWGRYETQLRLVRIGSTLYEAMTAASKRKATPDLSPADYVVGGVYLTRKLEGVVYLGRCDLDDIVEVKPASNGFGRGFVPAERTVHRQHGVHTWVYLRTPHAKGAPREDPVTWIAEWERQYTPATHSPWQVRAVARPALIRQICKVQVDFARYQRTAVDWVTWYTHTHRLGLQPIHQHEEDTKNLCHAVLAAHVRPTGQPRPDHPEYAALWASLGASRA